MIIHAMHTYKVPQKPPVEQCSFAHTSINIPVGDAVLRELMKVEIKR